jgi:hypothetical protein
VIVLNLEPPQAPMLVPSPQGARLPSNGTLVVGREQDCEGGCFDSEAGAAGDVQDNDEDLEVRHCVCMQAWV